MWNHTEGRGFTNSVQLEILGTRGCNKKVLFAMDEDSSFMLPHLPNDSPRTTGTYPVLVINIKLYNFLIFNIQCKQTGKVLEQRVSCDYLVIMATTHIAWPTVLLHLIRVIVAGLTALPTRPPIVILIQLRRSFKLLKSKQICIYRMDGLFF